MKFLDLRNDWAFKRVLGSRESAGPLRGFLNDALHDGEPVIESVKIIDPYLPSQINRLKDSAVDVRARMAGGGEALIEMQMLPVAGYGQRLLYNGAKAITSQLGRGADYSRIRPVTVISIMDFRYWKESPDQWFRRYAMREENGRLWEAGGLDMVFIELPKVDLALLPPDHPLRDWLDCLKNASDWRNIPRTIHNPAVRDALNLARHDSLTPTEADKMSRRQLYKMDQINMRRYAQEEGMKEGMKEGKLVMAAWALSKGHTPEEIAQDTGLPLAEVRALAGKPKRRARKLQAA